MVFDENSAIVQSWVRMIQRGTYTREQIPNIGNLQTVVIGILDKTE